MFALPGDFDEVGAGGDGVDERGVVVELVAELVEVGDFELGALFDLAGQRLQFAQNQADQRGFACAVGAEQAKLVAAQQGSGEVFDQRARAVAIGDVVHLGDDFARALTRVDLKTDLAGAANPGFAGEAQLLQTAYAAFVAAAPGLHAFADPDFFLFPEFVELAVVYRFDFELFGFFGLIRGEVADVFAQHTPVEFDDAVGDVIQKAPVVGDEQQRAAKLGEQAFEPVDRGKIEVVGRLVEQQQLGVGDECAAQRDAFFEAAGEGFDPNVRVEVEALQGFFDAAVQAPAVGGFELGGQALEIGVGGFIAVGHRVRGGVVGREQSLRRADAFGDGFKDGVAGLEGGLLRDISELQAGLPPHVAGVGLALAGEQFQQAGFAGAVAPDQADAFARFDDQRRAVEQGVVTVGEFETVEGEEGHGMGESVCKERGIIRLVVRHGQRAQYLLRRGCRCAGTGCRPEPPGARPMPPPRPRPEQGRPPDRRPDEGRESAPRVFHVKPVLTPLHSVDRRRLRSAHPIQPPCPRRSGLTRTAPPAPGAHRTTSPPAQLRPPRPVRLPRHCRALHAV